MSNTVEEISIYCQPDFIELEDVEQILIEGVEGEPTREDIPEVYITDGITQKITFKPAALAHSQIRLSTSDPDSFKVLMNGSTFGFISKADMEEVNKYIAEGYTCKLKIKWRDYYMALIFEK
jgi:hypothetical protein